MPRRSSSSSRYAKSVSRNSHVGGRTSLEWRPGGRTSFTRHIGGHRAWPQHLCVGIKQTKAAQLTDCPGRYLSSLGPELLTPKTVLALAVAILASSIAGLEMRVAQVSPLYESCPPKLYGGTERVVSYLTEELVRQGHEVTLFASGDSRTTSTLRAPCDRALRLDPRCKHPLPHHLVMLNRLARTAAAFDVVHFHTDYLHFPLFAEDWGKTLTTLHGRLDLPDLLPLMREFAMMPLVSISNAQRTPMPWANWYGTVYHGLPTSLYAPGWGDGGYLAFIGRICPEKRPDLAIEIARRAGLPLTIAAKVDKADRAYYKTKIKPLLKDPRIEFIGEIGDSAK